VRGGPREPDAGKAGLSIASEHFGQGAEAPRGEDHVYFFVGDKGACGMPRGPIYITHWGMTNSWRCMGRQEDSDCERQHEDAISCRTTDTNRSNVLDLSTSERGEPNPCADCRSIIAPPFGTTAPDREILLAIRERADANERHGSWPYELTFAGGVGGPSNTNYVAAADTPPCRQSGFVDAGCYSQGVRQEVFRLWANRSRFRIRPNRDDDITTFGDGRFCLAPSGDGFGLRLYKAILIAGCVPLIIQPQVRQAFDDLLPYEDFSLRLSFDDLPVLEEKLAAISPARHARMRQAMLKHQRAFTYPQSEYPGDAYAYLVESLRQRAGLPLKMESGDVRGGYRVVSSTVH